MPWSLWLVFFVFVFSIFVIDLFFIAGKKQNALTNKEAIFWTLTWILCAALFVLFLWIYLYHFSGIAVANQKALEFISGYFLEKSLSIDNIFVMLMIFTYFKIPTDYQRRVLTLGILGAIVLRLLFILFGVYLIHHFTWILMIFGVLLFYAGIHLFFQSQEKKDISKNSLFNFIKTKMRVTHELHSNHFFIRKNGLRYATPLFLALLLIEICDIIFAFDSIPAIFGITQDTFIIFTSNIFAILGLRALYFLLINLREKFSHLHYGLGFILCFIGVKMLIHPWIQLSTGISLFVIILTLLITFFISRKIAHESHS